MGSLGFPELLVILVILLLVFGPSRLGDLGSSLGKGIKGFRKSMKEEEIDVTPARDESKQQISDTNLDTTSTPSESKKNVR
ncbi:MAG: twin-arginine translocase TatA/TatE family subunit [Thermodesulfobacteriota bacterium]